MDWKQEIYQIFHLSLDKKQIEVILDDTEILQIIAGAGSGKTFTICCKVYYLVKVKGVKENDILILSYTNFACQEIKTYFEKMELHIQVITFHKFGLNLLRGFHQNYQIVKDRERLIEAFLNEFIQIDSSLYFEKIIAYMSTKHYQKRLIQYLLKQKYMRHKLVKQKRYWKQLKQELWTNSDPTLNQHFYQYKINQNVMEFQDMIQKSMEELKKRNKEISYYRYLFIDEFQDISEERFYFIKMYQMKTNCKLIVVGDDYQCIFQYADADVSYFIDFHTYFPQCKICYLNTTYRNSQELLDYASKLIQKNEHQIRKQLVSSKHLDKPIVFIYYKEETIDVLNKLEGLFTNLFHTKENRKILILGRYQFDLQIFQTKQLKQLLDKKPRSIQIDFLTIHQSKGLGYDEVVLLNLKEGKYGFPSTSLKIDIEEERRLFYVALTRTKNHIYLLIPQKNPSIFVEELFSGIDLS